MRKIASTFLILICVLLVFNPCAYARDMKLKEFTSYCKNIQVSFDVIWNSHKPVKTKIRMLSANMEKIDPYFKIAVSKGNFIVFDWKNEIDAVKKALAADTPDEKEIGTALNLLRSRIRKDLASVTEISQSKSQIAEDKVRKAVGDTLKGPLTIEQPGASTEKDLNEKLSEKTMGFLERVLEKIGRALSWIDSKIGGKVLFPNIKGAENLNWLVVLLVIGVLVYFFINIFKLVSLNRISKIKLDEADDGNVLISLSSAIEKAEKQANSGDYLAALKELLKGFFMGLDEKNLIPYRTSRTNREYRYTIPQLAPDYATLARDFLPYMDDVLYGGKKTAGENYFQYKKALESAFKH